MTKCPNFLSRRWEEKSGAHTVIGKVAVITHVSLRMGDV